MQRRRTVGKTAFSDDQLMLRDLLQIKDRREQRLKRQISALEHQQQQSTHEQHRCQLRRAQLMATLSDSLAWHGTLSSGKLLAKKQQMGELFSQERELATQQQQRLNSLQQLVTQQGERQSELLIIMKKKEKIRMALADEHYQS